MNSKTKIIVLHMKEIIYTAVFIVLAILLIILLAVMFRPGRDTGTSRQYTPGTYTSTLSLNDNSLEVEVNVDENHINSIRFSNLDESITTMYPLIQPAMETLADQVCQKQSLEDITLPTDNPYTSQVILDAISQALEKAGAN